MDGDDKQEMRLKMAARSANQENRIQRVQWPTKENEKLRGVLVQNDKMLKPSQEEVLGDADLKEKYLRVKKQLWKYQERENNLQDKENALLEKEEACTQKLLKQGKDLQRQLAEVRRKEEALTQEKQRHEEEIKILKKQLGETQEHEVLLKEALAAVQTNEKCLRDQLVKLQLENQNLSVECEKCRADCKKQEEETQSVKRWLSETHKQEYLLLKEQLRNKELALETSQTSEEHLKEQVTQLIQENETLGIELERHKDDLWQLKERYQYDRHKVIQNSNHQRNIIETLKSQLAITQTELDNSQAHINKNDVSIRDLQSKLEQLWALLENEKAHTQKLLKQGKDLQRQLAEVRMKEEALTQEKQRHEEEIKILKKQLGETQEHEVLLKEALRTKSEAMAAVQTNEKFLREQLVKLQRENQNLSVECEKCRADCKKQEEMYQYHCHKVRQNSEHQRNIEKLKAQLAFTQTELHNSRAHIAQRNAWIRDLQSKLEQLWAEYQLVESDKYHPFMSQHWASQQIPMPSADHLPPHPAVSMSQQPSPAVPQMCQPQQMQFNQPMCPPVYSMPPAVSVPSMI